MSFLKRDLEASVMWENAMAQQRELENDPGIRAHRSISKRMRPDLSNKSDTDVLEWLQRAETNAREFYDQFAEHPSLKAYDDAAEEIVDCCKRLIIAIQDARENAGTSLE